MLKFIFRKNAEVEGHDMIKDLERTIDGLSAGKYRIRAIITLKNGESIECEPFEGSDHYYIAGIYSDDGPHIACESADSVCMRYRWGKEEDLRSGGISEGATFYPTTSVKKVEFIGPERIENDE